MPTIAVSTYSFGPECTARQGIEFAVEHGFRGLELGSWTLWPDVMSDTDVREVRVQAAANGIDLSIHFVHRGVAPASHDPERRRSHLADLGRTLDLAHDIGARAIVVHPGPIDRPGVKPAAASEDVRRQAIENLADFLSKGARMAEERGAVLCVENLAHVPGYVIQSYDELVQVVEMVDSPAVRITLDVGHADLSDGLRLAIDAFSPYLRHVHMHDSDGSRDHFEVGKGSLDLSGYLDFLGPYPFTLAIESRDESDTEGCVLRSRDRLRELLGPAAR
ncbi:MAG: sugar phosphate isomerase/epimerase [Chloroflexi bacterium]|nr:sugar phosphate isomerase/epimerase [Chloroflexota bacterium]